MGALDQQRNPSSGAQFTRCGRLEPRADARRAGRNRCKGRDATSRRVRPAGTGRQLPCAALPRGWGQTLSDVSFVVNPFSN